jgi:hypothetical protein
MWVLVPSKRKIFLLPRVYRLAWGSPSLVLVLVAICLGMKWSVPEGDHLFLFSVNIRDV